MAKRPSPRLRCQAALLCESAGNARSPYGCMPWQNRMRAAEFLACKAFMAAPLPAHDDDDVDDDPDNYWRWRWAEAAAMLREGWEP